MNINRPLRGSFVQGLCKRGMYLGTPGRSQKNRQVVGAATSLLGIMEERARMKTSRDGAGAKVVADKNLPKERSSELRAPSRASSELRGPRRSGESDAGGMREGLGQMELSGIWTAGLSACYLARVPFWVPMFDLMNGMAHKKLGYHCSLLTLLVPSKE